MAIAQCAHYGLDMGMIALPKVERPKKEPKPKKAKKEPKAEENTTQKPKQPKGNLKGKTITRVQAKGVPIGQKSLGVAGEVKVGRDQAQ